MPGKPWYAIEHGDQHGFVAASLLTPVKPAAPDANANNSDDQDQAAGNAQPEQPASCWPRDRSREPHLVGGAARQRASRARRRLAGIVRGRGRPAPPGHRPRQGQELVACPEGRPDRLYRRSRAHRRRARQPARAAAAESGRGRAASTAGRTRTARRASAARSSAQAEAEPPHVLKHQATAVGPIEGAATVLDTGHLVVNGTVVALFGVDGVGAPYDAQMGQFVKAQGGNVVCNPTAKDFICTTSQGVDIAKAALVNGAARANADATENYVRQQEDAKAHHRGVWQDSK